MNKFIREVIWKQLKIGSPLFLALLYIASIILFESSVSHSIAHSPDVSFMGMEFIFLAILFFIFSLVKLLRRLKKDPPMESAMTLLFLIIPLLILLIYDYLNH